MADRRALLEELATGSSASTDIAPAPSSRFAGNLWAILFIVVPILLSAAVAAMLVLGDEAPGLGEAVSGPNILPAVARASGTPATPQTVLEAAGYVVARRQAAVSAQASGKIAEIFIEEGMKVDEGQLLARLDDGTAQAEYDLASARVEDARLKLNELAVRLEQAQRELGRVQQLADRQIASRAALERAELEVDTLKAQRAQARQAVVVATRNADVARQRLDDTEIRAPFAGIVTTKTAQPGEILSPVSAGGGFTRTGICTLVDMESLEVEVDVNEAVIDRVSTGQPTRISLNSYPDAPLAGEVLAVIPAADRNKATIRIRVGFLARDARVLPGMGVRVSFSNPDAPPPATAPAGVLVPADALLDRDGQQFVFVIEGDRVALRSVTSAPAPGGDIRILSGLSEGERVASGLSQAELARLSNGMRIQLSN